ncbi:hypothetical protein V8E54_007957 [Elaphomyces granulatus]
MGSVNNPAIMNLRDFVEEVGVDPSRPGMSSALQLKTSLNIPPLQAEHCDDIDISPIPTLIRLFCPAGQLHSFQQEVFIYAWGQFHVVCGSDETQIVIYAYSVDCHPGDYNDTDNYVSHCPGPSPPVTTILGTIVHADSQAKEGQSVMQYDLSVSVLGLNSEHNLNSTGCPKRPRQDRWTRRAVQPSITSQKRDFKSVADEQNEVEDSSTAPVPTDDHNKNNVGESSRAPVRRKK